MNLFLVRATQSESGKEFDHYIKAKNLTAAQAYVQKKYKSAFVRVIEDCGEVK